MENSRLTGRFRIFTTMDEYNEEWVMSRRNPNHGLGPVRDILRKAGNPQDQIHTIHVAGTNGKGSTCCYLQHILMAQGYRVGMFTSPHLITHRDRIRINDAFISHETFESYLHAYLNDILEKNLGMFEIDTLIAYTWFRDQNVDYAIIECGLGGRLDNTNVIKKPDLCVITTAAYDHMNILGSRIQQIANEKAGIFMPGSRAVCGRIDPHALCVVRKRAERIHCSLSEMPSFYSRGKQKFSFDDDVYRLKADGEYQKANASLALFGAWMLGVDIHSEKVKQAVMNTVWAGRFETVKEHPRIILDGAHNQEGMQALLKSLHDLPHPLIIVFSALKDKPGRKMAEAYEKACDHLIVTHFDNARADTLEDLTPDGAEAVSDWKQALHKAETMAGKDGCMVVTGSLYFISLVRDFYL